MTALATGKPRRRRARRVIIVLGAAILCGIASFWFLPWLFMSEDLRRVQGEWTIVRIQTGREDDVKPSANASLRIVGSRLIISGEPGNHVIDLEPQERKLTIQAFDDKEVSFLGFKVPLPYWLTGPAGKYLGEYELSDREFMLELRTVVENDQEAPLPDNWRKIYLRRK